MLLNCPRLITSPSQKTMGQSALKPARQRLSFYKELLSHIKSEPGEREDGGPCREQRWPVLELSE